MVNAFVALSLASSALAHGVVSYIDVNGQGFNGPDPNQSSQNAPEWTSGINPIKDPYSSDMFCGPNSSPNSVATIGAGSTMTLWWEETAQQQWPHNTGPIITYMAQCTTDCANMNADSAKWFKIDQVGFENGQWKQASLMNGGGYQVTIPEDLAAGDYLMRTEIISLHASRPQYYPRCVSWTITGDGSNTYSDDATATFPGTYSWSDAGLASSGSDIYNVQSDSAYQFPGPELITVGQGAASGGGGDGTSDGSDNSDNSTSSATQSNFKKFAPAQSSANVHAQQVDQGNQGNGNSDNGSNDGSNNNSNDYDDADENDGSAQQDKGSGQQNNNANQKNNSGQQATAEQDCESQWTQCNNDWVPGTAYSCQDEFVSCRGQVQRRLVDDDKMKRMKVKRDQHNRRRFHH